MSRPRMRSTAWLLLVGLVLIMAAGCGEEKTLSPLTSQLPDDGAPPAMPTGLKVIGQVDTKVTIQWTANTEMDLVGYRVYRYDPNPLRQEAYQMLNAQPVRPQHMTVSFPVGTSCYVRVTAEDSYGNESPMSDPLLIICSSGSGTLPGDQGSDHQQSGAVDTPGGGHDSHDMHTPGDLPIER